MAGFFEFLKLVLPSAWFDRGLALNAFFLIFTLALISILIFNFYNSISKRNLLSLNLYKYNRSAHPSIKKVLAICLYLIEYVFVVPFFIMLWFTGFSIVLLLLEKDGGGVKYILLIATALIGAIRVLAYVKKSIAVDLAKLFPFITLSVVLLSPGAFNFGTVFSNFAEIPALMNSIFSYLLVIFSVEIILRIVYTVYLFWKSGDPIPFPEKEDSD